MAYSSLLSFGMGAWLGVAILASGLLVLAVGQRVEGVRKAAPGVGDPPEADERAHHR